MAIRPKATTKRQAPAKPGNRGPSPRKTQATRERIIDACEQVIAREGVQGLGINAIADQAGLGKPLIYRYFGSLDGVVAAWARRTQLWVDTDIVKAKAERFSDEEKYAAIRAYLIESATSLREQPFLMQLLAHTMSGQSPLSGAVDELKKSLGTHHGKLYANDDIFGDPDMIGLILVLYAATMYLAHRAVGDPNFNSIRLDTDDGWSSVMDMVGRVFDDAVAAQRTRKLFAGPNSTN